MRDQQRKFEAAQADYERLSRQLDEFDEKSAALREEAQQLVLQVEQANADIRAVTEANAGSESEIAVLKTRASTAASASTKPPASWSAPGRAASPSRPRPPATKPPSKNCTARSLRWTPAWQNCAPNSVRWKKKAAASGQRRDVIDAAIARLQDTATAAKVRAASAQSAKRSRRPAFDEAKQQAAELENSAAAAEEEKRRAERRLKDAEEAVTRNDNIKAGLKLKLESRRRQQAEAADALQKADKERSNTSQRIHILEDLERNMDGYQQSVKAVMRAAAGRRLRGIIGPVAGILTVEKRL